MEQRTLLFLLSQNLDRMTTSYMVFIRGQYFVSLKSCQDFL